MGEAIQPGEGAARNIFYPVLSKQLVPWTAYQILLCGFVVVVVIVVVNSTLPFFAETIDILKKKKKKRTQRTLDSIRATQVNNRQVTACLSRLILPTAMTCVLEMPSWPFPVYARME